VWDFQGRDVARCCCNGNLRIVCPRVFNRLKIRYGYESERHEGGFWGIHPPIPARNRKILRENFLTSHDDALDQAPKVLDRVFDSINHTNWSHSLGPSSRSTLQLPSSWEYLGLAGMVANLVVCPSRRHLRRQRGHFGNV